MLTKGGDVVPAEDLEEDGVHVGQVIAVLGSRQTVRSNDSFDLSLCLLLDLGVKGHGEVKRVNRRDRLFSRDQWVPNMVVEQYTPCRHHRRKATRQRS